MSGKQRRPGGVGGETRRRHPLLVAAGNIHRVKRRTAVSSGIAEEHQHAPARREDRAFIMEARGENSLAGTIGLHDADRDLAAALLGEGDIIDSQRPYRRRVAALAERYSLRG